MKSLLLLLTLLKLQNAKGRLTRICNPFKLRTYLTQAFRNNNCTLAFLEHFLIKRNECFVRCLPGSCRGLKQKRGNRILTTAALS